MITCLSLRIDHITLIITAFTHAAKVDMAETVAAVGTVVTVTVTVDQGADGPWVQWALSWEITGKNS